MQRETKNPLVIHLGLVLAETICASAFYVELQRALNGNRLSWAYVFEWPIFAAYAVYVWKKLLSDLRSEHESPPASEVGPASEAGSDEALRAYNDYLRRIHGGGPDDGR